VCSNACTHLPHVGDLARALRREPRVAERGLRPVSWRVDWAKLRWVEQIERREQVAAGLLLLLLQVVLLQS
jgi:hypothetical protein